MINEVIYVQVFNEYFKTTDSFESNFSQELRYIISLVNGFLNETSTGLIGGNENVFIETKIKEITNFNYSKNLKSESFNLSAIQSSKRFIISSLISSR